MPAVVFRVGLVVFIVLAGTVAANVMALQPIGRRAIAPLSKSVATVTEVASSADAGAAAAVLDQRAESTDLEIAVRRELKARGYMPGDGDLTGYEGRAAILAFESDSGLPLTAAVRPDLLQHLLFGVVRETGDLNALAQPADVTIEAREVIAAVQRALERLGHRLDANGLPSLETQRAIRAYEAANDLPITGRVSGPLVAKLLGAGKSDHPRVGEDRLRARVASQR